jgi:type IV fimbrial biogenesis protein FimT
LIELMITIAVVAILAAVALPSMQNIIKNNRLTAQANDLVTAFQFARSEAIRKNGPIRICASTNGTECAGGWSSGWIVLDPDAEDVEIDGESEPAPAARVWPALSGNSTLTGPSAFTYESTGTIRDAGELVLAAPDCTGQQRRLITVGSSGRVSASKADCE